MALLSLFSLISVFVFLTPPPSSLVVLAQQPYEGLTTTACDAIDNSSSKLGYTCNGLNTSCQSYLIFRSRSPYNTVSSVSTLFASSPSRVSSINSVSESTSFGTDRMVIVPITCSCSGQYYQENASYVVQSGDTFLYIANNTYQALSTCQALQNVNNMSASDLSVGASITVPVRCACPTKNQSDAGINYLLTYATVNGDVLSDISERFGADFTATLEANGLSGQDTIYAFTTLLIPLENPPTSSQTTSPSPPPSSSPPPSPPSTVTSPPGKSSSTWVYVTIGVLGGIAVIAVLGTVVFFMFFRGRTKRERIDSTVVSDSFEAFEKPSNKRLDEDSLDFLDSVSSIAQSIKVYTYEELQAATKNFSSSCLIKGSVYRGKINGDHAAIKRMNGNVSREAEILSKISHSSLIRLSGVCFDEGQWFFVYEYAVNGPLSEWIYQNNSEGRFLTWMQRMQIALDVATGLNYLHLFTTPPFVHKNIKSSNILLHSDFRAKIASLGLARSAEGEGGEFALTRHIVGTKGYMAPEYLENGLISVKLDVYAFGVLLLEMMTGKEVISLCGGENMQAYDIVSLALAEDGGHERLMRLIDPTMSETYPLDLAVYVVRIIKSCLKKNPVDRPSMDEIVQSLSKVLTASLACEHQNILAR
ncbi:lysM domain receptor-like kinase 4 [Rhodamnia argentea]|uniref:LysM domain receptor-like kinase 4 n=1 Tax=Rhodamnia argentea TaxID=178133 RepID=A0A8B8MTH5_9MYRT|nr:lysM domain receptor-like kinase 4 [Rhodamnia argentea]